MFTPFYCRNFAWISLGMRAIVRVLAPRYRVSGRKNIPSRGPVIFAANHISDFDPPILGVAIRYPIAFMAKRELWKISWLGPILDFFNSFPVDPGAPDRAALKFSLELLKRGRPLVIFPEGRISHDAKTADLLPGAVLIALQSGAPVVPIGMSGNNFIVPYGSMVPRPTLQKVRVHFGPALDFSDLKGLPSREARVLAGQRLREALDAAVHIARET